MSYDKIIRSMKVGVMGPFYPVPPEVTPEGRVEWVFRHTHEMGCTTIDYNFRFDDSDEKSVERIKYLIDKYDIDPDMRALPSLYKLSEPGEEGKQARKEMITRCKTMHKLGVNIMRSGYGKNTIASSRFSRDISGRNQMNKLIEDLRVAASILEDEDIYLAIENHCDFNAREFVEIYEAVDSPYVGCALDTGNGVVVYSDPTLEYELLSPYVITTHIKDMGAIADPERGRIPFMACATPLGEGMVDIKGAIETMARKSKHAKGLHLIVEMGWMPQHADKTPEERTAITKQLYDQYIEELLKIVNR